MHVIHVITRLIVGGAQENTVATVMGLSQLPNLEVTLISGLTTGPEGSLESSFAQHPQLLMLMSELVRPIHPWKDVLAWRRLTCYFRERQPDIVHTHSGKAGILGRLAAHQARIPIIIHTIHGPSFGPFQNSLSNAVFRTAERRAGRITTHFISVAQAMTDQYLAAGIGRPSQYTRIFSGFDLKPFQAAHNDLDLRVRLGLAPGNIVIGKIARLFKLKGHDDLFKIGRSLIQACPKIKFLLVGDGIWRLRFEAEARALGLAEHFVFAGLVPPADVPRFLGIMDVVVHLSRREGLPRALPQALAASRPVVAYDCDGAREVCRDGETGYLVRPGDLSGLQDRLLTLARDKAHREKLGRQGQALVLSWFPVEKMITDIYALYCSLHSAVASK